ncbi:PREDICTED: ras GTPase-activating protein 4-like [Colobus angolensis palliatus]|uniref:ras GTPase-activating protein 4-like n=1 Tax=Colobus angolensis palliatus TaxID=336983 RepID=UPI0005F377B5|nr:PREDICTED: ras GTPase-activating protein 4-like [Colobus angolensis palliatus]
MAKRSSLYIRIVEGKNLPAKDITGSSDPYCIVKVDNEPIIRTATVWKTLCPFWGEEYQVHLPPTFHTVAFYVMDEDALSRDDVIGKVCLTRDTLASHPKGFSGWTHLTEVDPDEEVQGEIHLRLEVRPGARACRLRCSVLEARDLAPKDRNGASDPFVRVRYKGRTQETSIVKKSCYPRWNETFEFELEEGASEVLCVETWDWDLVSRNDFLGKVVIDIQRLQVAQPEEGWFRLQPEQTKSPRHDEGNLGSLQLEVRLRDEMVLPSSCYQPLVQLLCHEVKLGMQGPGQLISLIEETTSTECRQDVATNLLKLFLGQGLAKDFLDLLFQLELSRTSETNTLFRSNSLASKSMESFLKVAGMQYLHGVLGPIINKVFEEKKYVELDPSKVEVKDVGLFPTGSGEATGTPTWALHFTVCKAFLWPPCSSSISWIREQACEGSEVAKAAQPVAGESWDLPTRAVQNVGNMDTPASRAKEAWMEPLQPTVRQGVAQLKDFITKLVDIEEKDVMQAMGMVPKPPPSCLPQKSALIKLANIRAAEKVEEKSFGSSHVMQVIYTDDVGRPQTAYLQCKCVNELNQWLSALRKVSINNTGLLGSYHPGIFRGEKWSCCHQKEKTGRRGGLDTRLCIHPLRDRASG